MSKLERVKKVINWLKYRGIAETDADLAEKLGYKKSSLSQILNEKVPLSDKFIDKLVELDENINKVWIYEGSGDMFPDSQPNTKYKEDQIMYERLLEEKERQIRLLEERLHKSDEIISSL